MKTNVEIVCDLIMKNNDIEKSKLESICKYLKESKHRSYHFLSLSSFCDVSVKALKSMFRNISYNKKLLYIYVSIDCPICNQYIESVVMEATKNYYSDCPHCGRDIEIKNKDLIEDYCSTFKII